MDEYKRTLTIKSDSTDKIDDFEIIFDVTDADIAVLHRYFKRIALLMGYHPTTVERKFGEDIYPEFGDALFEDDEEENE